MTSKNRQPKKRFTTYLTLETLERLQELSNTTGIPMTTLFEEGMIDLLIKRHGQRALYEK